MKCKHENIKTVGDVDWCKDCGALKIVHYEVSATKAYYGRWSVPKDARKDTTRKFVINDTRVD